MNAVHRVGIADPRRRGIEHRIGGLEAAISEARRLGGVPAAEKISFLEFRHPRGAFLERVLGGWMSSYASEMLALPDYTRAQASAEDWVEEFSD